MTKKFPIKANFDVAITYNAKTAGWTNIHLYLNQYVAYKDKDPPVM